MFCFRFFIYLFYRFLLYQLSLSQNLFTDLLQIFRVGRTSTAVELWLKMIVLKLVFRSLKDVAMATNSCCRGTQVASGAAGRANVGLI